MALTTHDTPETAQHAASRHPLSQTAPSHRRRARPGARRLISTLAVLATLATSLSAVLLTTSSPAAAQNNYTLTISNTTHATDGNLTPDQRILRLRVGSKDDGFQGTPGEARHRANCGTWYSAGSDTPHNWRIFNRDHRTFWVEIAPGDNLVLTAPRTGNCRMAIAFLNKTDDCRLNSTNPNNTDKTYNVKYQTINFRTSSSSVGGLSIDSDLDTKFSSMANAGAATWPISVQDNCWTLFTPSITVNVTDNRQGAMMSDHDGTEIVATLTAAMGENDECSPPFPATLRVENNTATGTTRHKPIDRPFDFSSTTGNCDYKLTFPASVDSMSGDAKLVDNDAGTALDIRYDATDATKYTVTRSYTVQDLEPWELKIKNETTAGSPTDERTLVVTFTRTGTQTGCNNSTVLLDNGGTKTVEIAPASEEDFTLRRSTDCKVDLHFTNKEDDCKVTYTNPDDSTDTLDSVDDNDVAIAASGTGLTHAGGMNKTALTLAMTVADCGANFLSQPTITVEDTSGLPANAHDNVDVDVTYTPGSTPTGCTAETTKALTITNGTTPRTPVELVNTPSGQTGNCSYTVSFEASASSNNNYMLADQGTGTATVTRASSTVTRTYDVAPPESVMFKNSVRNHGTRNGINVTVTQGAQCTETPPTVANPIAINSMVSVDLDAAACEWDVRAGQVASACQVSMQPKNAVGGNVGGAVSNAALKLQAAAAGSGVTRVGSNLQVYSVELGLVNCQYELTIQNATTSTNPAGLTTDQRKLRVLIGSRPGGGGSGSHQNRCGSWYQPKDGLTPFNFDRPGDSGADYRAFWVTIEPQASLDLFSPLFAGCQMTVALENTDQDCKIMSSMTRVDDSDPGRQYNELTDAKFLQTSPSVDRHLLIDTNNPIHTSNAAVWSATVTTDCLTRFTPTIEVNVTDNRPGAMDDDHDGTTIRATISKVSSPAQHADCTGTKTVTLTLADNEASGGIPGSANHPPSMKLLDRPLGGNSNGSDDCKYEVTFEDSVNSDGVNGVMLLEDTSGGQAVPLNGGTTNHTVTRAYTIPAPVTNNFSPMPSVTVTDTTGAAANAHDNTRITVTYTPVSTTGLLSGCTASATQTLTVTNRATSASSVSLVDVPDGGTDGTDNCTYTASFQSPVSSGNLVLLNTGAATATVSKASASPSRTYDAKSFSKLVITNATTANSSGHTSVAQRTLAITFKYLSGTCNAAGANVLGASNAANSFTVAPEATETITIPAQSSSQCWFEMTFGNQTADCNVRFTSVFNNTTYTWDSATHENMRMSGTSSSSVRVGGSISAAGGATLSMVVQDKCGGITSFAPEVAVDALATSAANGEEFKVKFALVRDNDTNDRNGERPRSSRCDDVTGYETEQTMVFNNGVATVKPGTDPAKLGGVVYGTYTCRYVASIEGLSASLFETPTLTTAAGASREITEDDTDTGSVDESEVSLDIRETGVVEFKNVSSAGASNAMTVTIERGANCPSSTPVPSIVSPIAVGASSAVALVQNSCVWNFTVTDGNKLCQVEAVFKEGDQAGTEVGSSASGVPLEFSLTSVAAAGSTPASVKRTGDSDTDEVASVELKSLSASNNCASEFGPTLTITVNSIPAGTTAADLANTAFAVEFTPQSTAGALSVCTTDATMTVRIPSSPTISGGSLTATGTGTADLLVGSNPGGSGAQHDCVYNVEFPNNPAIGGSSTTSLLEQTGADPTVSGSSRTASRTYTVVTDSITFRNTETTGGTPAGINVTVARGSGCTATPPTVASPIAVNSSTSARLAAQTCNWNITATQVGDTCLVSMQPKNASGNEGAAVVGSTLALRGTANSGVTRGSSTTKVISVELSLVRCETKFTPAVTVNVTESRQGKTVSVHNGAKIGLTFTPVSTAGVLANCSPRTTDELTLNSSGMATGGPELVDVPKGGADGTNDCSYRVSFGSAASDGATLVDAGTATATVSQASATVTRAYTVVTDSVNFRNTTTTGGANNAIAVTIARGSGCPATPPSIASSIAAGASAMSRLGMSICAWNITATQAGGTCVVSQQPKSAGGSNVGAAVVDGTLVLNGTAGSGVFRSGSSSQVLTVDLSVVRCQSTFTPMVSISVTDTLEGAAVSDHNGVVIRASLSPVSAAGACTSSASVNLTIANRAASGSPSAALVDLPKGGTSNCQYRVSLPDSQQSGSKTLRLTTTGQLMVSAASPSVAAAYRAEETPVVPVTLTVGVGSAPPVDEGNPLVFPVSLSLRASQAVTVNYTVGEVSDSVQIDAGQLSAEISVPTDDDDLDEANQTIQVTLTSATGGASISPTGRTATGIVKDNDPSPVASLGTAFKGAQRLSFAVELSEVSGREVKVNYTTSVGNGFVAIKAGQQSGNAVVSFDAERGDQPIAIRLTSAQNATIDVQNRERTLLTTGTAWQFEVVSTRTTPREIASGLRFGAGWKLYSWSAAGQRWLTHTATSRSSTSLAPGTAITYRGTEASQELLEEAGLAPASGVTLRRGWNIFTPAPGAVGLGSREFTSSVIFDPQLTNCATNAGVLVIYTFDQTDRGAAGGFRLALPCHQLARATSGIPAITNIGATDTLYVWFNSTTPAELSFANGRYSPVT